MYDGKLCKICVKTYILRRALFTDTTVTTPCVKACIDGEFPDLVFNATAPTSLYLSKAECSACDSGCNTCVLGTNQNCTSCKPGFYLQIKDTTVLSGECVPKLLGDNLTFDMTVTGNREGSGTNLYPTFVSMPQALRAAFELTYNMSKPTVNIFLDPEVEHFVTY